MTTLLKMVSDLIKDGYLVRHAIAKVASSSLAIRYNVSVSDITLAYQRAFAKPNKYRSIDLPYQAPDDVWANIR
jgi:hypothetical protein